MKIIQTLWLPNSYENPMTFTGGWLSPEYHWLSWTLSVYQLRKFYDDVELFTTRAGKEVLINQLKLPYTQVHEVLNDAEIPETAWALSKIITYSLQQEPFLHVDGDVFIWKHFDETLLSSPLIVQNQEYDLAFYRDNITTIKEQAHYLPEVMQQEIKSPIITYNAGIFGGHNLDFIHKYAHIATEFVHKNPPPQFMEASSEYCMFFEQWFFGILAQEAYLEVSTLFKDLVYDVLYHELDLIDFWKTPQQTPYIHLMGMCKKNRMILKKMMGNIRKNYPECFYQTLRLCQKEGVELDFKIYQMPELNPSLHSSKYFRDIIEKFKPNDAESKNYQQWQYLYAKDCWIYTTMEQFSNLSFEKKFDTPLYLTNDFELIEQEEPELKQWLRIKDTFSLDDYDHEMTDIEMILIDSFEKTPQTLNEVMQQIEPYFNSEDFVDNQNLLKELIIPKVEHFMIMGVVCIQL